MIPDGTRIRVRLEENLNSATAELGETVDFAVTQEVRIGDAIAIANGARATGSIVQGAKAGAYSPAAANWTSRSTASRWWTVIGSTSATTP